MNKIKEIRNIELFSGIRGFGLGLDRASPRYKTVWANDINKFREKVYRTHYPEIPYHLGDITQVKAEEIPAHDLLTGGFPCQPFSFAGKRKGFKDIRGTLFFEICRIAKYHRPRIIFLENVKGLLSARATDETGNSIRGTKGYVFWRILNALEELGYWVEWQVFNSKDFGVPQHRERVFIIGHLRGSGGRAIFPITESGKVPARRDSERTLASTLQSPGHASGNYRGMTMIQTGITQNDPHNQKTPKEWKLSDLSRTVKSPSSLQNTLVARFPLKFPKRNQVNIRGDYAYTVDQLGTGGIIRDGRIRRKTPKEDERLQGFPDNWTAMLSDSQRYKALGDAVTVNVIEFIGKRLLRCFDD